MRRLVTAMETAAGGKIPASTRSHVAGAPLQAPPSPPKAGTCPCAPIQTPTSCPPPPVPHLDGRQPLRHALVCGPAQLQHGFQLPLHLPEQQAVQLPLGFRQQRLGAPASLRLLDAGLMEGEERALPAFRTEEMEDLGNRWGQHRAVGKARAALCAANASAGRQPAACRGGSSGACSRDTDAVLHLAQPWYRSYFPPP
jgi:hypothetical protein